MSNPRTVRLPKYPPLLMMPSGALTNEKSRFKCIEAIGVHYRLNSLLGAFMDESLSKEEMGRRWLKLSLVLMRDFVPAFKVRRKGGPPKRVQRRNSAAYPHAHAARLVQIVTVLRANLKEAGRTYTRTAAFTELVKLLKKSPAPDWVYGDYREASTFQQSWKKIRDDVKAAPEEFLPPPLKEEGSADTGGGLFGIGNWLVASEQEKVWMAIPPIPERLPR